MNNLFTEPDPRDRLLEALDPQGQVDAGRAVTIAHDLPADTATVLAELIHKRLARAIADGYDRGYRDRAEGH
jgi:hypothetical protein